MQQIFPTPVGVWDAVLMAAIDCRDEIWIWQIRLIQNLITHKYKNLAGSRIVLRYFSDEK